jgi:UDP-glucuronate decarboxylase
MFSPAIPPLQDDPQQRQPDISLAKEILHWQPCVELEEGLKRVIAYFGTRGVVSRQ